MKRKSLLLVCGAVLMAGIGGLQLTLARGCPAGVNQGCVNQGADCRYAGTVVCWLQRRLSWKSEDRPRMVRIGPKRRTHLAFAWPPYVVYNSPRPNGRWRVFRLGFRYDRTWRGYIFPTAAWKYMDAALEY